ncbi:MAG: hypothetical protein KAR79_03615, partial [Simkaniaceae bacterium]|nr:hypothetical protein [Simkaniaceae bacterium]
ERKELTSCENTLTKKRAALLSNLQSKLEVLTQETLFKKINDVELEILYEQVLTLNKEIQKQIVRNKKLKETVKGAAMLPKEKKPTAKTQLLTLEDI